MPRLFASHATLSADHLSRESLEELKIEELKELLRSGNQKVTGNKAELVDRILLHNRGTSESRYDHSLSRLPKPVLESFLRFRSSSAAKSITLSSPQEPPKLLPIQQRSFDIIAGGGDAVLFSATGTGKTLAYILPLAKRLWEWKRDGSLQHKRTLQKKRFIQQQRNKNDSLASKQFEAAAPSVLVIEPSRELAKQVGKVWSKFHPTVTRPTKQIVTVFGGVPTARQAALLSSKTDVIVGTPGRIRELIREGFLLTSHVRSIVLDEGDVLLNFQDNPEVEWLLEGMKNDYQLILASATINKRVEKFVAEVMELDVGEDGFVNMVDKDATTNDTGEDDERVTDGQLTLEMGLETSLVRHWSMAASSESRTALVSDLIVTLSPRRGIIFVPSKVEVETVAQELSERLSTANDFSVHVLHGDMVQAARSRTIIAFRGDAETSSAQPNMSRILVATDVASRGLDILKVDLVLQYGIPRKNGKEGTFDSELYIHRTGRAGRFGSTRTADTIVLYDRGQGEGNTLKHLQDEMIRLRGVHILPMTLPSPGEIMNASYLRALQRCEKFDEDTGGKLALVQYFEKRLMKDVLSEHSDSGPSQKESILLRRLAAAIAALSGLDEVVSPRSLLTANPSDRTIRVWNDAYNRRNPLSPPEVTKLLKALGSGKLGRITICDDGSALFDLSRSKAKLLLKKANDSNMSSIVAGWHFEMPESLSFVPF
jgi:superfamily II DNA/RNA helicase